MSQIPQDFFEQIVSSECSGSAAKRPISFTKEYQACVVDVKDPKKLGRVKIWIPDLMKGKGSQDSDKIGIWAMPANNAFTGNKEAKDKGMDDCGSCMPPPKGSYVTVYFEDGDYSYPRYKNGVNKEVDESVPVENQYGSQYWNKWSVMKTPQGRQVLLSDDPDDESTIIRGKYKTRGKRQLLGDVRAPKDSYYIQFWEKAGEEYMLIKDPDGKYLKMDKKKDEMTLMHNNGSHIKFDKEGNIIINAKKNILENKSVGKYEEPYVVKPASPSSSNSSSGGG